MGKTPWETASPIAQGQLHKADILLSTRPGWQGAGIRLVRWSWVSHAALVASHDVAIEAIYPHAYATGMNDFIGKNDHVLVLRHDEVGNDQGLQDRIVAFAQQQADAKVAYDVDGVMLASGVGDTGSLGVPRRIDTMSQEQADASFFCSELVVRAYEIAGRPIVKQARKVLPDNFLSIHGYLTQWFISTEPRLWIVGRLK